MKRYEYESFNDLCNELEEIITNVEKPNEILMVGAKEFVNDLLKLPKPISKIKKSGYTHLIDTFYCDYGKQNDVEVGWGKYYGRMVENGTKGKKSNPHLKPTFERNKEKYYQKMIEKIY